MQVFKKNKDCYSGSSESFTHTHTHTHTLMPGCHGELGPQLRPSMPQIHNISHASSRVTYFFFFFFYSPAQTDV